MEDGDLGNEHYGEMLPHPFCDFCEEFFYNADIFFDHLHKRHLTCHLCSHHHKNVYYADYENLEKHFEATHFICPFDECKAKCYVAFKTEDELRTHIELVHSFGKATGKKDGKVNAKALLGFDVIEDREAQQEQEDNVRKGRKRNKEFNNKTELKDKEGVNFNYYFGEKYQKSLENKRKKIEQRKE